MEKGAWKNKGRRADTQLLGANSVGGEQGVCVWTCREASARSSPAAWTLATVSVPTLLLSEAGQKICLGWQSLTRPFS